MDLILKGGRVVDPSQQLDGRFDVGFAAGRVASVAPSLNVPAGCEVRDVSGLIVTPGLIDMHTHVYWGGTSLSVDAEAFARKCGVTTAIDTGSAGPGNFAGFRKHVIEKSAVRILAYLHISHAGIYAFGHGIEVGESENLKLMNPAAAIDVVVANRDVIVGMKVRVGRYSSGDQGVAPLDIALQVAEQTGVPLMAHIDEPPPSYEDVVNRLRPGDVLTHCFRPFPNAPYGAQGKIKAAVEAARKRGVFFDVGHGGGSFAFKTARIMMSNGFLPDTISSDVHVLCENGPAFDQTTTLSKFLCLGMDLKDVIAASTCNAAQALQRPDLGTFRPGSTGDATILSLDEGTFDFVDTVGERMTGQQKLHARGVVIGGKWWWPE